MSVAMYFSRMKTSDVHLPRLTWRSVNARVAFRVSHFILLWYGVTALPPEPQAVRESLAIFDATSRSR